MHFSDRVLFTGMIYVTVHLGIPRSHALVLIVMNSCMFCKCTSGSKVWMENCDECFVCVSLHVTKSYYFWCIFARSTSAQEIFTWFNGLAWIWVNDCFFLFLQVAKQLICLYLYVWNWFVWKYNVLDCCYGNKLEKYWKKTALFPLYQITFYCIYYFQCILKISKKKKNN